jgi:hypothetical protein
MLHPRATSAGPADTGAVVSLGGWDSLFHIRLAPHLQRLLRDNLWAPSSVSHRSAEPLGGLLLVAQTAPNSLRPVAEHASNAGIPA